jgi:hypothetical protein
VRFSITLLGKSFSFTTLTTPCAAGLPLASIKRGFRDSNQPATTLWPRFGIAEIKILLPTTGKAGYTIP